MYGTHPKFADMSWQRWTESESSDWEALNANWDNRENMWYMPLDWVNYVDQEVFTKNYSVRHRYSTMLYISILQLGSNEIGPVNEIEMLFLVFNLIIAALLNSLLFGDIAGLIGVLESKNVMWQETLDGANFVMN